MTQYFIFRFKLDDKYCRLKSPLFIFGEITIYPNQKDDIKEIIKCYWVNFRTTYREKDIWCPKIDTNKVKNGEYVFYIEVTEVEQVVQDLLLVFEEIENFKLLKDII